MFDQKSLGAYQIGDFIKAGPLGEDYMAHDSKRDIDVVMTIVRCADKLTSMRDRFNTDLIEGLQQATQLQHPGIQRLFDTGKLQNGVFLIREYIEGDSLDHLLTNLGAIPVTQRFNMVAQLCSAFFYAHGEDVLHGPVNPKAILRDSENRLKFGDFGFVGVIGSNSSVDQDPIYSNPEHIAHRPTSPQSDQFSLAALCYQILTGVKPFAADNPIHVINRIAEGNPGLARPLGDQDLSKAFTDVFLKAFAKDPKDRFPDCRVFKNRLLELMDRYEELRLDEFIAPPIDEESPTSPGFDPSELSGAHKVVSDPAPPEPLDEPSLDDPAYQAFLEESKSLEDPTVNPAKTVIMQSSSPDTQTWDSEVDPDFDLYGKNDGPNSSAAGTAGLDREMDKTALFPSPIAATGGDDAFEPAQTMVMQTPANLAPPEDESKPAQANPNDSTETVIMQAPSTLKEPDDSSADTQDVSPDLEKTAITPAPDGMDDAADPSQQTRTMIMSEIPPAPPPMTEDEPEKDASWDEESNAAITMVMQPISPSPEDEDAKSEPSVTRRMPVIDPNKPRSDKGPAPTQKMTTINPDAPKEDPTTAVTRRMTTIDPSKPKPSREERGLEPTAAVTRQMSVVDPGVERNSTTPPPVPAPAPAVAKETESERAPVPTSSQAKESAAPPANTKKWLIPAAVAAILVVFAIISLVVLLKPEAEVEPIVEQTVQDTSQILGKTVTLTATPECAAFFIDGVYAGNSPFEYVYDNDTMAAVSITAAYEGYEPQTQWLDPTAELPSELDFYLLYGETDAQLQAADPSFQPNRLWVDSNLEGAAVFINDHYQGNAPLFLDLDAHMGSSVQILAWCPDYQLTSQTLKVPQQPGPQEPYPSFRDVRLTLHPGEADPFVSELDPWYVEEVIEAKPEPDFDAQSLLTEATEDGDNLKKLNFLIRYYPKSAEAGEARLIVEHHRLLKAKKYQDLRAYYNRNPKRKSRIKNNPWPKTIELREAVTAAVAADDVVKIKQLTKDTSGIVSEHRDWIQAQKAQMEKRHWPDQRFETLANGGSYDQLQDYRKTFGDKNNTRNRRIRKAINAIKDQKLAAMQKTLVDNSDYKGKSLFRKAGIMRFKFELPNAPKNNYTAKVKLSQADGSPQVDLTVNRTKMEAKVEGPGAGDLEYTLEIRDQYNETFTFRPVRLKIPGS